MKDGETSRQQSMGRATTRTPTEPYPSPSEVNVADSVTIKLCLSNYYSWKIEMLTFLETQDLKGFVNGTINQPNNPQVSEHPEEAPLYAAWERSDGLVRGWMLANVSEGILLEVKKLKTAREVWLKLEKILTPPLQPPYLEVIDNS